MGVPAREDGVEERNGHSCGANVPRLRLRWRGLCRRRAAYSQIIACEIHPSPEEQRKFPADWGMHLAGIVGDNFVEKGGDAVMG